MIQSAYYVNKNAEKVYVADYALTAEDKDKYFYCPCCKKPVKAYPEIKKGKGQRSHFRHRNKTYAIECDNYVTSELIMNKHNGKLVASTLPIYLYKAFNSYSLYLGFLSLSRLTVAEATLLNLQVSLKTESEKESYLDIGFEFENEINLVQVERICSQYTLNYIPSIPPKEVQERWGYSVNGISEIGAIFDDGTKGGKKLTSSSCIIVDRTYLLLIRNFSHLSDITCLEYEVLQELSSGWWQQWHVVRFKIKEINEQSFSFCKKFNLNLKYSSPEIINIWPPATKKEDKFVFGHIESYFSVYVSNNPEDTKNMDNGIQKISDNSSLLKNYKTFSDNSVFEKTTDIYTLPDVTFHISKTNELSVFSDKKVTIIASKNGIPQNCLRSTSNKHFTIITPKVDLIEFLYGTDIVGSFEACIAKEDRELLICDDELLREIKRYQGNLVTVPSDFRWLIPKLIKYPKTYEVIKRYLLQNTIPYKSLQFLYKLML